MKELGRRNEKEKADSNLCKWILDPPLDNQVGIGIGIGIEIGKEVWWVG